ncbi:MAG TPA: hypothetical protein VGQ65_12730 [Thermoanaerobaculia bacterium]|nr:hypothetical protein [Thermoanaerobaculia bacterium]
MAAIDTSSSNVSPIEAATRVHNLVYLAYVAVLVLAAFFTWLAWKTGNKVQDAIRADADARIAEASSKGTALENANLTLRGQLATLETKTADAIAEQRKVEIALSEDRGRTAKLELEAATQRERAAKADERAADAESSLLFLQKRTARRSVNGQIFLAALDAKPKAEVEIMYLKDDPDSWQIAMQLGGLLHQAGWKVKFPTPLPLGEGDEASTYAFGGVPDGVTVVRHWNQEEFDKLRIGQDDEPASAVALRDAISRAMEIGATATMRPGPHNPPEGTLRIVVAPKL